jgi:hypothetical protein
MAISLSTFSVFAVDLPKSVKDLHSISCPDYFTKEAAGDWVQSDEYKLPGSVYSKEGATLYVLGCEMYAYNSLVKAYIVDAYETKIVSVAEVMTDGSITATNNLMGGGFDPETNLLGTFQKGRGVGDCGSAAEYKYNPENQNFVLIEARLKDTCDGEDSDWPIVYKK